MHMQASLCSELLLPFQKSLKLQFSKLQTPCWATDTPTVKPNVGQYRFYYRFTGCLEFSFVLNCARVSHAVSILAASLIVSIVSSKSSKHKPKVLFPPNYWHDDINTIVDVWAVIELSCRSIILKIPFTHILRSSLKAVSIFLSFVIFVIQIHKFSAVRAWGCVLLHIPKC